MNDREDFEAWIELEGGGKMLEKYPSGNYVSQQMNLRWEGWQECCALKAKATPVVAVVNKTATGEYEFYPSSGLVDLTNGMHKLYTQSQQGQGCDYE